VIENLYDATNEEVDKVARCYDDIDQLRAAVTPVNMDLVQAHTCHIFWKFGSAIWSPGGQLLADAVEGDAHYDQRLVYSNPEDRRK
jgi:hypothetical protein